MNILEMIAEWKRGCSCSMGKSPAKCQECTIGLIDAIENKAKKDAENFQTQCKLWEPVDALVRPFTALGLSVSEQAYKIIESSIEYMLLKNLNFTVELWNANNEHFCLVRESSNWKFYFKGELLSTPAPPSAEQPSELDMHRADYQACKNAGFESPGELLAAYKRLVEQPDSAAPEHSNLIKKLSSVVNWIKKRETESSLISHTVETAIAALINSQPSTKPQRITEQDVHELCEDYCKHLFYFDNWFAKYGKTLLAKLNEHREPDYKAQRDVLLEKLSNISDFAVGNGDVCEIIAKRAREAIAQCEGE